MKFGVDVVQGNLIDTKEARSKALVEAFSQEFSGLCEETTDDDLRDALPVSRPMIQENEVRGLPDNAHRWADLIWKVAGKTAANKAMGPDSVPNEFIRAAGKPFAVSLGRLCGQVSWRREHPFSGGGGTWCQSREKRTSL